MSDAERAEVRAFVRKVYGFSGPAPSARAPREGVTYYAIVDSLSSQESPAGVLRRISHRDGERDEAFGRDLAWRPTFLLYSAERGNLDNDIQPISDEEAERIAARVRVAATAASAGP